MIHIRTCSSISSTGSSIPIVVVVVVMIRMGRKYSDR